MNPESGELLGAVDGGLLTMTQPVAALDFSEQQISNVYRVIVTIFLNSIYMR